jgi:hypothetical protein
VKKTLSVAEGPDGWFRVMDGKFCIHASWNLYHTKTGALAGMRAFARGSIPARHGPHVTPEAIMFARRRR